jgi:hypothetical protein
VNRRTCACGAAIICADLDGYDVWLDQHPSGWINLDAHGHATVGAGTWRRHTCAHDPLKTEIDAADRSVPILDLANIHRNERAAQRTVDAAQTVIAAGTPLGQRERHIAELRIEHPGKNHRQLAGIAGTSKDAVSAALRRVERRAQQLTQHAA